jgi:hypothetical protein
MIDNISIELSDYLEENKASHSWKLISSSYEEVYLYKCLKCEAKLTIYNSYLEVLGYYSYLSFKNEPVPLEKWKKMSCDEAIAYTVLR